MNFFKLSQPADKKIIGINDGGEQAEIVESKWKNKKELKRYTDQYILGVYDTIEKLERGEDVAPPAFEYIKLRPKAILTDFISFSEGYAGGWYLISQRVKELLQGYNLDCRIYENVPLYFKDKLVPGYSNLHLLPLKASKVIDFKQSVFFRGSKHIGKTYYYPQSFDEYLIFARQRLIWPEKLCFSGKEINGLDILTLDISAEIYISEKLTNAMQSINVSGIELSKPVEPELIFTD